MAGVKDRASREAIDSQISNARTPKKSKKNLATIKILVIEYTRINQKVIVQQLKGLGKADCVNNGQKVNGSLRVSEL